MALEPGRDKRPPDKGRPKQFPNIPDQTPRERSRSPMNRRSPSPTPASGAPVRDDTKNMVPDDLSSQQDWSSTTEIYTGETAGQSTDPEQDQDMGDPFTLVSYKKNRPQGIPVVFKPLTGSFWRVNPNVMAKTCAPPPRSP